MASETRTTTIRGRRAGGTREDALIGRDAEMRRIRDALRDRGALLVGPAGIGKTRLAHAAGNERDDADVYRIRGAASVASMPLDPILETAGPQVAADPTATAISVIRERRRTRPQMLVVDDAHLFDEESARVIAHLVDVVGCGAVITQRAGEPCPEPFEMLWKDDVVERIELEPLAPEAVAEMASALAHGELDSDAERWIVDAARGLPLCVRELVAAAIEDGDLLVRDGAARFVGEVGVAAPPRLREVIRGQVERLDPASLRALAALEVAHPLPTDVFARVASDAALASLRARGMAADAAGGLVPGHPLHGEAAVAAIPAATLGEVRREVAAALDGADPARSAVLVLESGVAPSPEQVRRGLDRALSVQRPDLAVVLAAALAALDRAAGSLATAAELHAMVGDWATANREFAEAAARATTEDDIAEVACAEVRTRFEYGRDFEGAIAAGRRARARLTGINAEAVAVFEARAHMFVDPLDPQYAAASERLRGPELPWGADGVLELDALTIAWKSGRVQEGLDLASRVRAGHERRRMYEGIRVEQSLTALQSWAGGARAAADAQRVLEDFAARSGNPMGEILVPLGRILLAARRGRSADVLSAFDATVSSARGNPTVHHSPLARAETAVAAAALVEPPAMIAEVLDALDGPAGGPDSQMRSLFLLARARLAFRAGRRDAASDLLAAGVAAGQWQGTRLYELLCHREHALLFGELPGELVRMDEIARVAAVPGGGLPLILADEARAVVEADAPGLDSVAVRAAQFGADQVAWEASVRAHALHRAAGRTTDALVAELRVRQVAPVFAAQWIAAPPFVSILSEREHQVLAEVAAGASNGEVAHRLFLSPHTVKRHLERIYARTGLHDRAALTHLVARARLDVFPSD